MTDETPAIKPPPHPQRVAKFPGRGRVSPHKRNTWQQEHHDKTMKRKAEPLHIAKHSLKGH